MKKELRYKSVGKFIGSIPLIKGGPVDEFLIGVGELIDEAEKGSKHLLPSSPSTRTVT